MKIIGIGVDIIENKRIKNSIKNHRFKERIYSSKELKQSTLSKDKIGYFSKRFAAKEAFAKALGTGMRAPVNFKSIEVIHDSLGKPKIKTIEKLSLLVKSYNIKHCHLSISDEKNIDLARIINL